MAIYASANEVLPINQMLSFFMCFAPIAIVVTNQPQRINSCGSPHGSYALRGSDGEELKRSYDDLHHDTAMDEKKLEVRVNARHFLSSKEFESSATIYSVSHQFFSLKHANHFSPLASSALRHPRLSEVGFFIFCPLKSILS